MLPLETKEIENPKNEELDVFSARQELAGKAFTPDMLRRLFGSRKNKSKYSRKKPERKKVAKTYGKRK